MTTATNHTQHNCVQSMFDTLIAINQGYDVMIERADTSVRRQLAALQNQHARDIAEIYSHASDAGFDLDRSGTIMGEVHKTAVKLRDLFRDIDRDALDAVVDGEENVLKRYDDAIKCLSPGDTLHNVLVAQRTSLRAKIEKLSEAA